jgi:O-succinylbenzoate synthase
MVRSFSFQMYQRAFVSPLRTAHGAWAERVGFIVRVADDSGVGYGEVAPIPAFGTETLADAAAFLRRLADAPQLAADAVALAGLPCCAFGIGSALGELAQVSAPRRDYRVAGLLPAGSAALAAAASKARGGFDVFKWKIGVEAPELEQALFAELDGLLPAGATLRLDANEGLSVAALDLWLNYLQAYRGRIEYLEQPLPVGREVEMARCGFGSGIELALDESLHAADGARWLAPGAWDGPLVVKPALAGDCGGLLERLRPVAGQVVLSSVFETQIGVENALRLADQMPGLSRVLGFDTRRAFEDGLAYLPSAPALSAADRAAFSPESIWNQLPHLI